MRLFLSFFTELKFDSCVVRCFFKLFILTVPLASTLTSAEPSLLRFDQCRGSYVLTSSKRASNKKGAKTKFRFNLFRCKQRPICLGQKRHVVCRYKIKKVDGLIENLNIHASWKRPSWNIWRILHVGANIWSLSSSGKKYFTIERSERVKSFFYEKINFICSNQRVVFFLLHRY